MARKFNLTVAQKIAGLEKALANPKTPKQLRPSLERRLAALKAGGEFHAAASSAAPPAPASTEKVSRGFLGALNDVFDSMG